MAMTKRTRTAILLQTFMIFGLVASMWLLGAGDSSIMSRPDSYPAAQLETRIFQSGSHNVLLFPAEHWQIELVQRTVARGRLADALLAGRLNLIEAAKGFRELDARSPTFDLESFQQHTPGRTDMEKYCRLVIMVVEGQLNSNDERAREVLGRLEKELNQHISRGPLHFSTPSDESSRYLLESSLSQDGEREELTPR
jgi:hypothetical protein